MDAMETLFSRRSIRKYTAEPVTEEVLREILEAAMSAPSAGNQQPWHFVIINDRKILDKIPSFHPHSQMLKEAPVAILVCGDLKLEKHTATGSRTVLPPQKISCLQYTQRAWELSGWAYSPGKKGLRVSENFLTSRTM